MGIMNDRFICRFDDDEMDEDKDHQLNEEFSEMDEDFETMSSDDQDSEETYEDSEEEKTVSDHVKGFIKKVKKNGLKNAIFGKKEEKKQYDCGCPDHGDFRKVPLRNLNKLDDEYATDEKLLIDNYNKSFDLMAEAEKKFGQLTYQEAKKAAERHQLDTSSYYKMIDEAHQKFDEEYKKIHELAKSGAIDQISAEHKLRDVMKKRLSFRRRIEIISAGNPNGWDDFSKIIEDVEFILPDADDESFKDNRHKVRDMIKQVPMEKRKSLIEKLYKEGKIDRYAYNDLLNRYTW